MKRTLLTSLLSALLVMGVVGATAVILVSGSDETPSPATSTAEKPGSAAGSATKDERSQGVGPPPWAKAHKSQDERSQGVGPPPWAQAHKAKESREQRAEWKADWQALTPAQREARMKSLARTHAEGMEKWGDCVAAAGTDKAKRAACEKPLPPGLAKRRP